MANINGYFEICNRPNGIYLHLIPPAAGGDKVDVQEVIAYLTLKNFGYNIVELGDFVKANKDDYLFLEEGEGILDQEMLSVSFRNNDMEAVVRFYPPYQGGKVMGQVEIENDLMVRDVVYGLDHEAVQKFVADRQYCTDIVIARGKELIDAVDAKIEYLFETDLNKRPTVNEDGSVDYKNISTICKCSRGQVLARIIPPKPGVSGTTVKGDIVAPRLPRNEILKHSVNVEKIENGMALISLVNGHVTLVEGKVFVSPILEVKDVDLSTGNVDFDGNITINGNVTEGFTVKATGDIEINGVVEAAQITAGGQVIIKKGINGQDGEKGSINAGGNVICKYIENAKVVAGGYIESDGIVNSTVSAKSHIIVQGRKGFIVGGKAVAGQYIEAKIIGSEFGANTTVEVGVDPNMYEEYLQLKRTNDNMLKEVARMEPVVKAFGEKLGFGGFAGVDPEEVKRVKELAKRLSDSKQMIKENTLTINKMETEINNNKDAFIRVTGQAYTGVSLSISRETMILKSNYHYCRFLLDNHEIIMKGL